MKRILHIFTALMLCSLSITPLSIHAGSDVYISDTYGVLSQAEVDLLNAQAQQISDQYQFGVYAHILYDDASYDDIWGYIEQYYAEQDLGYGNTSDGILFLITQSSQGGSYDIYIPAASNQSYFTIDGLEDIQDDAEEGLFEHDYYKAIDTFLDKTEEHLAYYNQHDYPWSSATEGAVYYDAETGRSVSGFAVAAGIIIPFVVACIVVAVNASKHRTKHTATDAAEYIPSYGQLQLTRHTDMYLYRTQSRTKIHHEESDGGGGGFSSSGGMHSGGGHF
ncbi:MAG: TPM domain-containing protein [Erysipelotrichaceae bacterium]|nr:TPM domain-containing protein [Erysipelotrichaceae bacterium]